MAYSDTGAFGTPPTDPYGSPLLHGKIKDLKKVYISVAGHDTLRDDGLLFKQKLDETGYDLSFTLKLALTVGRVPHKFDFYEGYPHYHWTWPSSKLDEPRKEYLENLAKGVQFVLS